GHIGSTDIQDSLSIQLKERSRHSSNSGPRHDTKAVAGPDEMINPIVLPKLVRVTVLAKIVGSVADVLLDGDRKFTGH
ncbi:MAG TPA: hypothetical protein VK651_01465, partial [Blastocatellia bacterium]|nr:hypothetical protein [Blastocatellia bacterium]